MEVVRTDVEAKAARLLAGPRGRALCAAVAGLDAHRLLHGLTQPTSAVKLDAVDTQQTGGPRWPPAGWETLRRRHRLADAIARPTLDHVVAEHVAAVDLQVLAAVEDDLALVTCLVEAVNDVLFFDDTRLLDGALESTADLLAPVAEAVVCAPAASWWWTPTDRTAQRWLRSVARPTQPPPGEAAGALAAWAADDTATESRSVHMVPFPARGRSPRFTGTWWARPLGRGLVCSTRTLPSVAAVGLAVMEDGPSSDVLEIWELVPSASATVAEIDGPAAWCELVEAFPREVTFSRRHDWWRWTGYEGRWFIPDWPQVAKAFDAVHVSVAGYLETAYRALPAVAGATCLAGWDPDVTIWLSDIAAAHWVATWDGAVGANAFRTANHPWIAGGRTTPDMRRR